MELTGSSLLVVADGRRARLFEERRRGGPLIEITAKLGDLGAHLPHATAFRGRVHDRLGPASHTPAEITPAERREADFLELVAYRSARLLRGGGHRDLVLMAAPRALGLLRQSLGRAGVRVALAEARDRLVESPEILRERLRDLRRDA